MEKQEIISIGQRVLNMEADAVKKMANALGDDFYQAVQMLYQTKGRVVVTGMGKSGHIGKKIAATLASVGTPAFFVHPAEASHGDLGMLTINDTILAVSNSGESRELSDIIAYSRRFGIPMICMVGRAESTLAKASDLVLCYPPFQEAWSFGMATTTSTTLSLALGDALAMVLLEVKGFSQEQYKLRHPGGKLGAMLLKVKELMVSGNDMPLVKTDALMADALIEMTAKSLGCVGIINNLNELVGIITDGDLRRHMSMNLLSQKAADIMTKNPKTISENLLAAEAVRIMNDKKITTLFVVQDNHPIGVLHLHRCLQAGVV